MNDLITPGKALGYSEMFVDFLSGKDSARHFYASAGIEEVAAGLDGLDYNREKLVEILKRQNRSYGASNATIENIHLLRDKKALCAFAGQQAILFGGPFLIILKALSIIKTAQSYSKRLSRPVVPMFWMAGDDHDFEEVNHTWLINREGEPVRIAYGSAPEIERPMAETTFADGDELERAKEMLRTALGDTDFTPDLHQAIERAYRTGATFVEAFAGFMTYLTGRFGLVLFSPGDPEVKKFAAPFFLDILDRQQDLHTIITTTNQHIEQHGYHLQVQKKDNATHLFCNLNGRRPVMR
ncbi:MAG: bacillithiol biosynthesis BshC, partial [Candidatus Zixiibacteriota bacterium]